MNSNSSEDFGENLNSNEKNEEFKDKENDQNLEENENHENEENDKNDENLNKKYQNSINFAINEGNLVKNGDKSQKSDNIEKSENNEKNDKIEQKEETLESLKAKLAEKDEKIKKLQNKILQMESEIELNIVDSKIKMADLINRLNEIEYQNERLQGILLSAPGKCIKLIDDLDKEISIPEEESKKIRRSIMLMRSLSLKITENVTPDTPNLVISDRHNRANFLFESIITKLCEFNKVVELCTFDSLNTHFFSLAASINNLIDIINKRIADSEYLSQTVSFLRFLKPNEMFDFVKMSQNEKKLISIFEKLLIKNNDGTFVDSIDISKEESVFHPFQNVKFSNITVLKRSEKTILASFINENLKPSVFGKIQILKPSPKKEMICFLELAKLFNQIWKYKNVQKLQTPIHISTFKCLQLDNSRGAIEHIPNIIPISNLRKTRLKDAAREKITYALAGTYVACYILGVPLPPNSVYFNKDGEIFIFWVDSFFRANFKFKFPDAVVDFMGEIGINEVKANCLYAFLNIRKFGLTMMRFAKIILFGMYDEDKIDNYIKKSLFMYLDYKTAIENFKKILNNATGKYKKLLADYLK